jgi:putative ABC transport system permease protein
VLLSLSLRSLWRRRTRTALALAGIAVSAALLLDMTMLASGLSASFESLFGLKGYELRVTPRGTLPFDSEAGIEDAARVRARIAAVPGVRSVAPVLGARLYRVVGDSLGEAVFANGIDPSAQMLYTLLSGRAPAAGEVVISQPLARERGLGIGDTLRLAAELDLSLGRPREVTGLRVSGIGDFLYDSAGQHSVALPLAALQRATRRPDEVSLFAVAADAGANEDSVAARIERAAPAVSAYSMRTLLAETNRRLLYFRQLATILGSVALVVTALLISTIVTIGVRERFGEIATLRAIGVARRRLLGGVVVEGLALAAVGCLLGLPLGIWVAGRLDAILRDFPGLPARLSFFVWSPTRALTTLALVVAVGALAGLLPGWGAVRAPLAAVLREEGE